MNIKFQKPVLGFAAYSGTGKTTLLTALLPLLKAKGIRVAMIKHAHHDFDIDKPGKDSYELRQAGADQVLIASSYRRALLIETPDGDEPELEELVSLLDLDNVDLVLVEGFRHLYFPKIELHRPLLAKALIYPNDSSVLAIASDEPVEAVDLPQLELNNTNEIADFVSQWLRSQ